MNQYHDYQYGMEEGRFFTILGTREAHSNIHILPIHVPSGADVEESSFSVGDLGSIPGSEAPLEKEMATYASILALRTP